MSPLIGGFILLFLLLVLLWFLLSPLYARIGRLLMRLGKPISRPEEDHDHERSESE